MTQNTSAFGDEENRLTEQATELVRHVERGDFAGAMQVIADLNETRDRTLYEEVGRLTRTLHEAIRNFNIELGNKSQKADISKISDASDRLAYVVDLTGKAANKTMDLVEQTMPLAVAMKEEAHELKDSWSRLRRREMKPAEFRELHKRVDIFFTNLAGKSDVVYTNLSEILLAQDYQDLTGQVIQKVTGLVREVEENLVQLVAMAGKVDRITGIQHEEQVKEEDPLLGQGPQIDKAKSDVVSSQDDVDDLLSSLGF
jgi:chemotaxis protein CheZ